MCGHVGIAGALDNKDDNTIKRMLLLDYFRGTDSTGFAAINRLAKDGVVVKIASHPIDLFDMDRFKKALSPYQSSVYMGHNRATTRGATNGVNAHPFKFKHIIGCHNGTLTPASFKVLNDNLENTHDVDSAAVFDNIAEYGITETMKDMQGAWALVWVNLEEGTLNFLRNDQRPFWLGYSKTGDKVLWASEHPVIQAATALNLPSYELYEDGEYGFWQLPVDVLYSFKISEIIANNTGLPPVPVKTPLKGKEPAPVTGGAYTPFRHTVTTPNGTTTTTTTFGDGTTTSPGKERTSTTSNSRPNLPEHINIYRTQDQQLEPFITSIAFLGVEEQGCSWCQGEVKYEGLGNTFFDTDCTVLCPSCSISSDTTRVYVRNLEMHKERTHA